MKIDSQFRVGEPLPNFVDFTNEVVKNEPMFFNCSWHYMMEHGGPISHAFGSALFQSNEIEHLSELVIDTRVHMLMPGWYPCIPGYHHDDVPRSRSDGQPNYVDPEYRSKHALALINGDICPTEFAVGEFELSEVPEGDIIYKRWHEEVVKQLDDGVGARVSAPSNSLVYFDDRSFHQGVPAVEGGWRWFGRASWNTNRVPTNEMRRQVQVYLENPMEGW